MTNKKVLTLQDISCVGQCSMSVAHAIISACGIETVMLPSALLSTHTGGFTDVHFHDLTSDILPIVSHFKKENLSFDCLYTGYLGSIEQIEYVDQIRESVINADGLLIVDPVMGDHGRLYKGFDDAFVARMAALCADADLILPNITEACLMTGIAFDPENNTESYYISLISALVELGAKNIVLKGVSKDDNTTGVMIYDSRTKKTESYFTKKMQKNYHGTGDCFAASLTGALMQGRSLFEAARIAADFVVLSIEKTIDDGDHAYGTKFEKALPLLVRELNK